MQGDRQVKRVLKERSRITNPSINLSLKVDLKIIKKMLAYIGKESK